MDRLAISLCPNCDHCPEVVIEDGEIRIGEDANTAVLKADEWNVLVELIRSGQLGRV
jgi:hypothetical protein